MSDPYQTLGVSIDADDETIHSAYLTAVKNCPPERDVVRFETVRNAYEAIRTRRARIAHSLFDKTPPTPAELLDRAAPLQTPQRPTIDLFMALLRGDI